MKMSEATNRDTNEDSEPELSSNDSSRLSSSGTSNSSLTSGSTSGSNSNSSSSTGTGSICNSNECEHGHETSSSDRETNGHICQVALHERSNQNDQEPSGLRASSSVTEESRFLTSKRDDVIQRSKSTTSRKCDTTARTLKSSCPSSPRSEIIGSNDEQTRQARKLNELVSNQCPSTSELLNCASVHSKHHTLKPVSSVSATKIDTNNNKNANNHMSTARLDYLPSMKRNNFSKSASGSRLMYKNNQRSNVCDCLSQQCGEKEHSNRRQFIENYYNSRTRLPSSVAMSSLNISSPLNKLSECDEITKRLLSSPIRAVNFSEHLTRRTQIGEVDRSRRASLGTNTLTEQVPLFTSNQFNSLEINCGEGSDNAAGDNRNACDSLTENIHLAREGDSKLKQQQGRSLSVCQEDSLNRRFRNSAANHSSNLNRAVSLAYESGPSKQMLAIIPLFGCDIRALEQFMQLGLVLPPAIESVVEHILAHGATSLGIFRKSGVKSRILTLRQRIESNQDVSLEQINRDNEFSIYDIADLVKMWFRELKPMPIMTQDLIKLISEYLQSSGSSNERATSSQQMQHFHQERTPNMLGLMGFDRNHQQVCGNLRRRIDSTLTPTHKALFLQALKFFASISSNSEINQMTSQNLAICLTPSLCATESDQSSILVAQRALKYCIDNYRLLF